jgi:hypothetical protein
MARFRSRPPSGSPTRLRTSVALLVFGSAAWLGLHAHQGIAADPSSSQATRIAHETASANRPTLTAAQRARAAQTHLLAVRTHEAALRQRGSLPEDQARWEHALASAMRAVYSVRHAPGGEQLGPQVKLAVAQLAAYAELMSPPAPRAVGRSQALDPAAGLGTGGAAEAAVRLDAAWTQLQALASRGP